MANGDETTDETLGDLLPDPFFCMTKSLVCSIWGTGTEKMPSGDLICLRWGLPSPTRDSPQFSPSGELLLLPHHQSVLPHQKGTMNSAGPTGPETFPGTCHGEGSTTPGTPQRAHVPECLGSSAMQGAWFIRPLKLWATGACAYSLPARWWQTGHDEGHHPRKDPKIRHLKK